MAITDESARCAATHQAQKGTEVAQGGNPAGHSHIHSFIDNSTRQHLTATDDQRIEIRNNFCETLIPVTIDSVGYESKPKNAIGAITVRMQESGFTWVTADQFNNLVRTGHSFSCGCYYPRTWAFERGAGSKNYGEFRGLRLVALDFDNTHDDHTPIEWYEHGFITPVSAIERCVHMFRLMPICVYESFSSTAEHPRFRMVIDLGTIIEDEQRAKNVIAGVMARFPECDPACADVKNRFMGTGGENAEHWRDLHGWIYDLERDDA